MNLVCCAKDVIRFDDFSSEKRSKLKTCVNKILKIPLDKIGWSQLLIHRNFRKIATEFHGIFIKSIPMHWYVTYASKYSDFTRNIWVWFLLRLSLVFFFRRLRACWQLGKCKSLSLTQIPVPLAYIWINMGKCSILFELDRNKFCVPEKLNRVLSDNVPLISSKLSEYT